jgi:hypothetical protein
MSQPQTQTHSLTAPSPLTTSVQIDRGVLAQLRPAAAKRKTTSAHLAADLLAVIAKDELVDAILDDFREEA